MRRRIDDARKKHKSGVSNRPAAPRSSLSFSSYARGEIRYVLTCMHGRSGQWVMGMALGAAVVGLPHAQAQPVPADESASLAAPEPASPTATEPGSTHEQTEDTTERQDTLDPTVVGRSLPPSPPDTPSGRVSQPWAIVGSLVPGILVHGTGSWLSGDDDTARRLLILQGGGIALSGGSLAALALTGAARDWVGLFATTSVLGVGAIGVSLLADVYRTAAPEGFGSHPGHVPWGDTELGVLSVTNPQLELGPIVSLSANIRTARWTTAIRTWHAPWSLHARAHLETGFQFWGAREDAPDVKTGGGHTTLFFGITGERYGLESFSSYGSELRLETRIDSEHLAPNVRGAFVDWELGYAARRTAFSLTRTYNDDSLLIAGVAFGAYHGDPLRNGGATRLYYNHRHDGYTGGMLIEGIGSGVAGRVGIESRHFITPTWGVRLGVEKGSAWVIGIHLITRIWNQSSLLNSISNSLTPSQPSPDANP